MLQCAISNVPRAIGFVSTEKFKENTNPLEKLSQALLSCELSKVEKVIHSYQQNINDLLTIVEALGRILNSRELIITAKKFSWKRGTTVKWGVVCEFRLVRAQRILLIPTEPDFPSIVVEHLPGTVGTKSCDAPALLMCQIGKIVGLPTHFAPPPLMASSR